MLYRRIIFQVHYYEQNGLDPDRGWVKKSGWRTLCYLETESNQSSDAPPDVYEEIPNRGVRMWYVTMNVRRWEEWQDCSKMIKRKKRLEAHWKLSYMSKISGYNGHFLSALCMCPYAMVKLKWQLCKWDQGLPLFLCVLWIQYSLKQDGVLIVLYGLHLNFFIISLSISLWRHEIW